MLDVNHLHLVRGRTALVTDLSFRVAAASVHILKGPNGTGKTTLLRAIAGLIPVDGGTIQWHGESVRTSAALRRDLGWLPHHSAWKDELTTLENLDLHLQLAGVQATRAECTQMLEQFGIAQRRHIATRRLSQGQRRRLSMAALVHSHKPLWLMDEPQNALDDAAHQLFEAAVDRHIATGGTVLIATHLPCPWPQSATVLGSATPSAAPGTAAA
jgi:heme exporter protein A